MLNVMRKPRPDLQLLANGDILFPVKGNGGGWQMSRVHPDDAEYADWLCEVQDQEREPGMLERGLAFWVSGVLLFFGLIAAAMIIVGLTHAI